ncbi:hypothetical protein O181_004852 [Austropuccinia psidii MF-1]|uniref:Uncharacterized protein n=1 Tax=Austropuccinia psidii MF-1 TaxID=1389203 RepID=A0A9Q3BHN4_9BASI|nr:hypothetical protein [Austropuccinia psidii MF-1]
MIRRFCAYILEFKEIDCFTHYWRALISALELEYNTPVHPSTGHTSAMSERARNTRLPQDTLRKDLIDIYPKAFSFNVILDKVKHLAKKSMNENFEYTKQKWDKSHEVPGFKLSDLVLASILNFINIKGSKKLKYYDVEPFFN